MGYAQTTRLKAGQQFDYDVCQYNGKKIIGGERYEINITRLANPRNYEQNDFATNFVVAPNPASDYFTLSFELANNNPVGIILYDVNGKVVRQIAMNNYEAGNHQQRINTTDLSTGMYFLKINMGNTVLSKKVVLQKN